MDSLLLILLLGVGLLQACTGPQPSRSQGGEEGEKAVPASASEINPPEDNGDLQASPPAPPPGGGTPFTDLLSAKEVLAVALAEADQTKRLVFLHSGASW